MSRRSSGSPLRSRLPPRSCGGGAGLVAGTPALLAGSACCAPVVVLVLGVQVTWTLITVVTWQLPASVLLLVATALYVAGRVDPTALAAGT